MASRHRGGLRQRGRHDPHPVLRAARHPVGSPPRGHRRRAQRGRLGPGLALQSQHRQPEPRPHAHAQPRGAWWRSRSTGDQLAQYCDPVTGRLYVQFRLVRPAASGTGTVTWSTDGLVMLTPSLPTAESELEGTLTQGGATSLQAVDGDLLGMTTARHVGRGAGRLLPRHLHAPRGRARRDPPRPDRREPLGRPRPGLALQPNDQRQSLSRHRDPPRERQRGPPSDGNPAGPRRRPGHGKALRPVPRRPARRPGRLDRGVEHGPARRLHLPGPPSRRPHEPRRHRRLVVRDQPRMDRQRHRDGLPRRAQDRRERHVRPGRRRPPRTPRRSPTPALRPRRPTSTASAPRTPAATRRTATRPARRPKL